MALTSWIETEDSGGAKEYNKRHTAPPANIILSLGPKGLSTILKYSHEIPTFGGYLDPSV